MLYVFVGALVLGGILLGASVLTGDGHGDTGGGPEADFHVDADAVDAVVGAFRSLRFWVFFLAFFGLSGTTMLSLGIVSSSVLSTLLALLFGSSAGWFAVWAFKFINRKESNSMAGGDDFVGKSGRILVPITPGDTGKIRIQAKGSTVDLLAKSDETMESGTEALVIEMEGTVARVARADAPGFGSEESK
jgi:membrane protein implicated in regulation of membrane protease activity